MKSLRHWCVLMLAAACAGCGGVSFTIPRTQAAPQPLANQLAARPAAAQKSVKDDEALVQEALQKAQSSAAAYRVSPADLLEITVYQEKDMDRKVRVGPDGMISFPLVGSVQVGGLQVAQAERALVNALKKFILDPQVSILIQGYGIKTISILGEVMKPGSYPLPAEATLSVLEAITLAGGFTQYADQDSTRVIRKSGSADRKIVIKISAITQKGDKSRDIPLEPNDVVYVPEGFF